LTDRLNYYITVTRNDNDIACSGEWMTDDHSEYSVQSINQSVNQSVRFSFMPNNVTVTDDKVRIYYSSYITNKMSSGVPV